MIASGIYVGFALDTYRRITYQLRKKTVFKFLLEIIFWLVQTYILFYILFRINNGDLRVYVFLACFLGFSMYMVFLKQLYGKLLETVIRACLTITSWVIRAVQVLLIQPVIWIFEVVYAVLTGAVRLIIRFLVIPFKLVISLCQTLLPEKIIKNITKYYALCSTIINKLKRGIKKTIEKWR